MPAALDVIVAAQQRRAGAHRLAHRRFGMRRHSKMHGDRAALVLEQGAGVSHDQRRERRSCAVELRIDEACPLNHAGRLAPFDAVQARGGEPQRREQRIEVGDAAAAHQRNRAAQALGHIAQQCLEA